MGGWSTRPSNERIHPFENGMEGRLDLMDTRAKFHPKSLALETGATSFQDNSKNQQSTQGSRERLVKDAT